MAGRASGVKMGDDGGGSLISPDGVAPSRIVGVSASYLPLHHKTQKKMVCKNMIVGYHNVGAPTCLHKQKVGKPSQHAAQPCAKAEGCVHDDLRADKLQKGWGFGVSAWNVDSLTGRAGELVEWHTFKKHDGEVVVAGFLELKAKDINCSGWEIRRDLMV